MKYKALVIGKNNLVIDDFFIQMDEYFEVLSCSTRFGDISRHLKYFTPDVFIYCLYNESQDNIKQMINIKPMLRQFGTAVVIIGTKEDCVEFNAIAPKVSDMDLMRPFTTNSLREKIVKYLDMHQTEKGNYNAEDQSEASVKNSTDDFDIDSLKNALASLDAALNSAEGPSTPATPAAPAAPATPDAPVTDNRKHILVVDDDPIMLKTVKEQLRDDYDVATAISGKIAMKFLERKTTDLILLDYEMPGENGPDVLSKIRDNENTKYIPVVFLTGVSDREKIQEAIALKPQGYLLKPIDHDKLMETIRNTI